MYTIWLHPSLFPCFSLSLYASVSVSPSLCSSHWNRHHSPNTLWAMNVLRTFSPAGLSAVSVLETCVVFEKRDCVLILCFVLMVHPSAFRDVWGKQNEYIIPLIILEWHFQKAEGCAFKAAEESLSFLMPVGGCSILSGVCGTSCLPYISPLVGALTTC